MNQATDRTGIEFISVFGLPPAAFVELAAGLGCRHIGMALSPFTANPHRYPAWSLRDEPSSRAELISALRDHEVSISLGEGFLLGLPNVSVSGYARDLDLMKDLGAVRINALSVDADRHRAFDDLARLAAMAAARGLETTLEFVPGVAIGNLPSALDALRHVGRPDFKLLVDVMHVFRTGSTIADLAAIDPAQIGYLQLCDVPLASRFANYGEEARHERLPPGEGELPLLEVLRALPRNLVVGLEVPMLAKAMSGIGPGERLTASVEATRAMLRSLGD